MQQSLDHLPEYKQEEVQRVVQIIKKAAKVEMIILYGSYARGDWVEDKYVEEHVLYEYTSDYDVLVIVKNEKREQDVRLWHQIRDQIARDKAIKTPVSLIVDNIDFVNQQLSDGRYFYADIQKEGILLHDSGKYQLVTPRVLTPSERKALAEKDYEIWLPKVHDQLERFSFSTEKNMFNLAAFDLHQATESLLICFLLVRSGYRPKTHDLEKLLRKAVQIDPRFQEIFPRETQEEEEMFLLLKKAYVDARYDKNYAITREQLTYLRERIERGRELVEKACKEEVIEK